MFGHRPNSHFQIQQTCIFHGFLNLFLPFELKKNVDFNLMHPQHFGLLKVKKKQGRYEVLKQKKIKGH